MRESVSNQPTRKKTMSTNVTIKVPACWQKLIGISFNEDDPRCLTARVGNKTVEVVDATHYRTADDDPKPYYDDNRSVEEQAENGARVILELCSGQSNYYGGCTIIVNDEEVYSETWESFDTVNEVETYGGDEYTINVEWI